MRCSLLPPRPLNRSLRLLAALALGLGACPRSGEVVDGSGDPSSPVGDDTDRPEDTDEEPACTPVLALLFDLGDTLVVQRDDGLYEARPGVPDLLVALRAAGRATGIVTNVPRGYTLEDLGALLADPTLLENFDLVLLSSEASADPKPDPAIFSEALSLLPSPPPASQAAFVTEELAHLADGDPPTEGAMAAGLLGVHLSDAAPSALVDFTVSTAALPDLAGAPWVACVEAGAR